MNYPKIKQTNLPYGLIGNCQILAMVHEKASIDWACFPRFDSPSIFAKLLDEKKGGCFSISAQNPEAKYKQYYIRNTNILVTHFDCEDEGKFEVIDFAPRFELHERYFKPTSIFRIVRLLEGSPRLVISCKPKFNYGAEEPEIKLGSNHIEYSKDLRLTCSAPLNYVLEERPMKLEGDLYFVLSWGAPLEANLKFTSEEFFERTKLYWETWVKRSNIPSIYQDEVIRASLAIKLHAFNDTGAIIAASTTSIPEADASVRNWDYRYCWLRDAYFVIKALDQLGHYTEKERFVSYLSNLIPSDRKGTLQPVYGISGEAELTEIILEHLDGFKGNKPVRIGNAAYTHKQFDVYGEMVLCLSPIFFDRRLISYDLNKLFIEIDFLVNKCLELFNQPDASIWEFRSEESAHTFSQVFCWAGVDRGAQIAERMGRIDLHHKWSEKAEEMKKFILEHAWCQEAEMFTQRFQGCNADASNLLMAELGIIKARDPRFISTVHQYGKILRKDDYMFRYINQDDFGLPKTSFNICNFWYINALIDLGEIAEAKRLYDLMLSRTNHVGLLSEDLDFKDHQQWGNFPQTYSLVGIITTAKKLESCKLFG